MADLSNYAENLLIQWLMTTNSVTRPTAWYLALHTGDPGETGASNEVSGSGYARQQATFAGSNDTVDNDATETFTASGGNWGAITHMSIWDALTTGNCLWKGTCTNRTINDGDSYQFAAADIDLTIA